ncbi:MAG: hypothetical protein RRY36_09360 [Bacteroidaceae bacterium]
MEPILQKITKLPPRVENTLRITRKGLTIHGGLTALSIIDSDCISIYNDKMDPKSIYIKKSSDGYRLIKRGRTYMVNCLSLYRRLKDILEVDKALYKIGEPELVKNELVVPIITVKNLLDEK